MMQMKHSVIVMVVLLLAAPGIVWSEEDPISPPTSEIPKTPAPAPKAPAPKADVPAAQPDWSPPSTVARRELPADNLPAPLVRDPSTGSRLAGSAPLGSNPVAAPGNVAPGNVAPGNVAPGNVAPGNVAPGNVAPGNVAVDPLLGTATPGARSAASTRAVPRVASSARIESVAKVHNLPLPDKKLALRLDITFAIQGERGRAVYLEVDFQRLDTGKTVRSTLPVYANPNGTLAVRTALSTVPVDMGRYAANVWVPYQAFPGPTDADMYSVTANVRLQRSEAGRAPTTLANATTTFNVHAPAPAVPDNRELLPRAPDVHSIDEGPLDIDVDPVELDDPFAPPVAAGSPDGK